MMGIGKKKKHKQDEGSAAELAETLGRSLGKAAGKVDKLNKKRTTAVADLQEIIARAQKALSELEVPFSKAGGDPAKKSPKKKKKKG